MGLYDDQSQDTNALSYAFDNHAAAAGDPSIFDSLQNVITKGIPLTGLSVVNSFANTGIELANVFGAGIDKLSVEDEVGDGDLLDYYNEHATGIETAGLIAGSLIPGMAAVKALKLAQLGKFSASVATATNIFAGPKQRIIEGALEEIKNSGSLYNAFNAEKIKAIALGFGDQALQGLAYEVGTAATMKASPLLDEQSFGEVADNMLWGALTGGGFGGVIEGVGIRAAFNKAVSKADDLTKAQEVAKYLGIGDYMAGDRVAALLDSLDSIPAPTNNLGAKKLSATTNNAILEAKKALGTMVASGDKELTNSVFDVLYKMKTEGNMSRDDMFNYFARLSKVSRITATDDEIPNGTTFFLNKFAKDEKVTTWENLATNSPNDSAVSSLRYRLRDGSSDVKIARFSDSVEYEGQSVPKYTTAEAAWADDNDIYINAKGQVSVNDAAPNIQRVARAGESRQLSIAEEKAYRTTGQLPPDSKPLYGAPLVLNTITGDITEHSLPVLGDFGNVKLISKGVQYGEKGEVSLQDRLKDVGANVANGVNEQQGNIFGKSENYLDDHARYIWAALRGLKSGDTIRTDDIPMLEQLYREGAGSKTGFEAYMRSASERGIQLSDKTDLPTQPQQLLNRIRSAKDDLIHDLIQDNPKMSAEEAALRANVKQDYIANGMQSQKQEDWLVDPKQYTGVNHVKLQYNIGNIYQQDGQILRGMLDVQYRINLIRNAAQSTAAKFFGDRWDQFVIAADSSDAKITGVGAKFLSQSNADYGTLGQETERLGREVQRFSKERMAGVSEALAPSANGLREDQAAAAEQGMFRAVRQRTGEKFAFLPDQLVAKYFPDVAKVADGRGIAVLKDSLKMDKDGNILDWNREYLPENFVDGKASETGGKGLYNYYQLSPKVAAFEQANQKVNDARLIARNNWYSAQGLTTYTEPGTLYTPPPDTGKYPHFALVKARPGTGMADDGTAMIVGENANDLEQKIDALKNDYQVYTKADLKKYHEVLGDYEYNRNFSESRIDSELRRRGILNNIFPDTRAETIIKDYVDWHSRQELRLVRDHVELANGQLFEELRQMGSRFTSAETSQTGFTAALLGRTAPNPYNSYIKTSLNISEKDTYRFWQDANEKLEAFFDSGFRAAKDSFSAAQKGMISYEDAAQVASKFGLGNPYEAATDAVKTYYNVANKLPPDRYLTKFVAAANSFLGATVIRLDTFQQMIHVLSTPILLTSEAQSVKSQALQGLLQTELPNGSGKNIPAISKVMFQAVRNWFDEGARNQYMPFYKDIQAVRTQSADYFRTINELTLPYGQKVTDWQGKMSSLTDTLSKYSGANLSETFTSWMAADVGRQLFQAIGFDGKELTDNISSFVNRVKGNLVSSQRPVAFQGPIGQAVGLFQTYQFNLFQQLLRYMENGEKKAIAMGAALQTTMFGLQSLPGFQMLNNHIIGNAAGNPSHNDIYGATENFMDKKLGDYLLYGAVSNVLNAGLYTRGDINPRQITLLPVNPLNYPAIAGGIRFVSDLYDTSKKIAEGGSIGSSLLIGLEHNGLSRPLQGLAQLMNGYTTTSKGQLIAATRPGMGDNTAGLADYFDIANYSRLLGARPLDEATQLDALYRSNLYKAKDTARMEDLGKAVMTKMYGNQSPSAEDISSFVSSYQASGGQIQNFGKKMLEWSQHANVSIANRVFGKLGDPLHQNLMRQMGGLPLPDFSGVGSIGGSETTPQPVGP